MENWFSQEENDFWKVAALMCNGIDDLVIVILSANGFRRLNAFHNVEISIELLHQMAANIQKLKEGTKFHKAIQDLTDENPSEFQMLPGTSFSITRVVELLRNNSTGYEEARKTLMESTPDKSSSNRKRKSIGAGGPASKRLTTLPAEKASYAEEMRGRIIKLIFIANPSIDPATVEVNLEEISASSEGIKYSVNCFVCSASPRVSVNLVNGYVQYHVNNYSRHLESQHDVEGGRIREQRELLGIDTNEFIHTIAENLKANPSLESKFRKILQNDEIESKDAGMFLKFLNDSAARFQRGNQGNRYDGNLQSLKQFCTYIYLKGGLSCYTSLYNNLPIPSAATLKKNLQENRFEVGKLYTKELKDFLDRRNLPYDVVISEDATRLIERVEYDHKTNELYGLLAETNADTGLPKSNFFEASTPSKVLSYVTNYKLAPYLQLIIAKPLKLGSLSRVLGVFGTDNAYTAKDVIARWKFISAQLNEFGIRCRFSSDADPKLLKAMKQLTKFGSRHYISGLEYPLMCDINSQYKCVQDAIHEGNKFKTRLQDSANDLVMGKYVATIQHLKILQNHPNITKNDHFLTNTDIGTNDSSKDKMNATATRKICDERVINLLKTHVDGSLGTVAFLKLIRCVYNAYIEQETTDIDRVYNGYYVVSFLRRWRKNIKGAACNNFVTSSTWISVEMNFVYLLDLVLKGMGHLILVWNSQTCEQMFRSLRSLSSWNLTEVNFTMLEAVEKINRVQMLHDISFELKDTFVFDEHTNIASDRLPLNNIPINRNLEKEEVFESIINAALDAKTMCIELGMIDTTECNPECYLREVRSRDQRQSMHVDDSEETDILRVKNLYFVENSSENQFFQMCDKDGNIIEDIKKSRFLWLLLNDKERVSPDRLLKFRKGRKELTAERVNTTEMFYKDTALIPGDYACFNIQLRGCVCVIGQIVNFQCADGEAKGEKRFPFSYLIFEVNKDVNIRLLPSYSVSSRVDIITSSNVLAERDANDYQNKAIFSVFGIKIDHNCHSDPEKRRHAYKSSEIVYGVLGNFQRDYLLTEFYEEDFMLNHHFENVLVDEVDSMLLDKGNNILYLSQDLPDIEEIESVFVFIWKWLNDNISYLNELNEELLKTKNKRNVKDLLRFIVLDAAYGILDEDDVEKLLPADEKVKAGAIINTLKNHNIISHEHVLSLNYNEDSLASALASFSQQITSKIKFYCHEKITREKQIKIPKYFNKFVNLHLDKWIENGIRALSMSNEKQYIIDRNPNSLFIELDPNIIILDLDTGSDMTNSQWDEGLHQFLQLKHGCQLSSISLKSVFISNVSYFKLYKRLYGMTGTLGALDEREKLQEMHELDYATIPRHLPQKFIQLSPTLIANTSDWSAAIVEEVKSMFINDRSVLIICETIDDIKTIRKALKDVVNRKYTHIYKRDYEDFNLGKLGTKHVILATNLAGRGTDIKLSDDLKETGGLHVILTYLPTNIRIENQAFGRAARTGAKGTGRLIIIADDDLSTLKHQRDQDELIRLSEVNSYYRNFITIEEGFFKAFSEQYRSYSKMFDNKNLMKHLLENFKLQWSYWLDENSKNISDMHKSGMSIDKSALQQSFQGFLKKFSDSNYVKVDMIPVARVRIANLDEINESTPLLNDSDLSDLITIKYYNIYNNLKNQKSNDQRDLTKSERKELKSCIRALKSREMQRNMKSHLISHVQKGYEITSGPINGYASQQSLINEIEEIHIESLNSLLGKPVTPESFHCSKIQSEFQRSQIYEQLLKSRILNYPKIDVDQIAEINEVALKYQINPDELKSFLEQEKDKNIKSLTKFSKKMASNLTIPSREDFWNILIEEKLLKNVKKFAVVDQKMINEIDPSIFKTLENPLNNFFDMNEQEINLYSTLELQEQVKGETKMIFNENELKLQIGEETFDFLVKYNAIEILQRGTVDLETCKSISSFSKFSEIDSSDLDFIENHEQIIETLISNEILNLNLETGKYVFNYDLSDAIDLGENYIYEEKVKQILYHKSSYQIAFQTLLDLIENSDDNNKIVIHLQSNPHLAMLHDLIDFGVIDHATVNYSKINQLDNFCKNAFNEQELLELFARGKLDDKICDVHLINKLYQKGLLVNAVDVLDVKSYINLTLYSITEFDINERTLGELSTYESTIRLILQNQRLLSESKSELKSKLESFLPQLRNPNIEQPKVVLKSIKDLKKDIDPATFHFFELKGFDMIIQVQQATYNATYWWRYIKVVAFGLAQITTGVILTIMTAGLAASAGAFLINEGIGDLIFATNTLTSGHFRWNDYQQHKLTSVITSITMMGVGNLLSRTKWIGKFFQNSPITKFGDKLGFGFVGMTGNQLINTGVTGAKGLITKHVLMAIVSNGAKAISMAAVSIGANLITQNVLGNFTTKFCEFFTSSFSEKFKTHEICDTITKLLAFITPGDLMSIINEKFTKAGSKIFDIVMKISEKIDELVQAGHGINKMVAVLSSLAVKAVALGKIVYEIMAILKTLNNALLSHLRTFKEDTECFAISDEDAEMTQNEIATDLGQKLTEKLKTTIEMTVITPAIKYAGNYAVSEATRKASEFVQTLIESKNEKTFGKEAEKSAEILKSLEGKEELTKEELELKEIHEKKTMEVLSKTKSPELHAQITRLDVPMDIVGVEATAKMLTDSGEPVVIIVNHEGIEHPFGDATNPNAKVVYLELTDGHFKNSNNSSFGNDCLYNAMVDQLPQLKDKMDAKCFRNNVADVIATDDNVRALVKHPERSFFFEIGFSGGKRAVKKIKSEPFEETEEEKAARREQQGEQFDKYETLRDSTRNADDSPIKVNIEMSERCANEMNDVIKPQAGLVKILKSLYTGRKKIGEVDHMPPNQTYKGTIFEGIPPDLRPGLLLFYKDHREHATTLSQEARDQIQASMHQGDFKGAVKTNIKFLHETIMKREGDNMPTGDYIKTLIQYTAVLRQYNFGNFMKPSQRKFLDKGGKLITKNDQKEILDYARKLFKK